MNGEKETYFCIPGIYNSHFIFYSNIINYDHQKNFTGS